MPSDVAKLLNVSRVTVSQWFNGHANPHPIHADRVRKLVDVLDRAVAGRGLSARPCRTKHLPLVGAPAISTAAQDKSLPASLVARYGAESPTVLSSAGCDRAGEPVAEGIDVTRAEFEFAITHEGALDVDDILDRRTRIGLVAADRETAMNAAREMLAGHRSPS
jgi:glycerol-3-phosphate dehydrogenase